MSCLVLLRRCLCAGVLFFAACAFEQLPSGGPEDKIPPTVIDIDPDSAALNYNGQTIRIRFDKYMNRSSLPTSLVFSPALSDYDLEWSGKEVTIRIEDTLKPERTYTYTLTKDLKDSRGNGLARSLTFAFSTGSEIDSGTISGKVYGKDYRVKKGATVLAFWLGDISKEEQDSLGATARRPDYISQTDVDGRFELSFMKSGEYRLVALDDQNRNRKYDLEEAFGVPSRPVFSGMKNVVLKLSSPPDTLVPQIRAVRTLGPGLLWVQFSLPVRFEWQKNMMFTLYPESKGNGLDITDAMPANSTGDLFFVFTPPFSTSGRHRLQASFIAPADEDEDNETRLRRFGEEVFFETDPRDFLEAAKDSRPEYPLPGDTLRQGIAISVSDSAETVFERSIPPVSGGEITITFTHPVKASSLENAVMMQKNAAPGMVNLIIERVGATRIIVRPKEGFEFGQRYTLRLQTGKLVGLLGNPIRDTVITVRFTTAAESDFGEVEGKIEHLTGFVTLSLERIGEALFYKKTLAVDSVGERSFQLSQVPPGRYFLRAFKTAEDGNLSQSKSGSIIPFRQSLPFTIFEDTLRVRKRWRTGGVIMRFEK